MSLGEVELFGGKASPVPPSLDETLVLVQNIALEILYSVGI